VDTTQTTTHLGLCAGYGGIELGLKRVLPTMRTVALCEIEAFACANVVAKMEAGLMDPAPVWTDLKTFPWGAFRDRVDILTGGYPCQPFSAAGKRLGTDDPRHLWPYIASGIRLLRPRVCFFENVEGHITLGLSSVISDLEELGYEVSWGIFSAAECGAPHQRKRVFILAHLCGEGLQGDIFRLLVSSRWQKPSGSTGSCSGSSRSRELADSNSVGSWEDWESSQSRPVGVEQSSCSQGRSDAAEVRERQVWPSRPGQPQHGWEPPRVVGNAEIMRTQGAWAKQQTAGLMQPSDAMGNTNSQRPQERTWQRNAGIQGTHADGGEDADGKTEPALGGNADGPASGLDYAELYTTCDNRTDELRLLGNGVVPVTAELAFQTLMKHFGKWEEVQS
jgi:DNA (cytosine-5)-methyltransferase 1